MQHPGAFPNPRAYETAFERIDPEEIRFYAHFLNPQDSVLSLGCGSGCVEAALKQHLPAGKLLGIDASSEMVERANSRFGGTPGLQFACCTLPQLPDFPECTVVISPLLTLNYLTSLTEWTKLMQNLASLPRLREVLIDVLIHTHPLRYQGVREVGEWHMFEFFDVLETTEFFSTISTRLTYGVGTDSPGVVEAPMALLHPQRFVRWVGETTPFQVTNFFPPHDFVIPENVPPAEARRALIRLTPKTGEPPP
ncbi:MAG: class I SAM-dependent methyltransferase [Candidatus Sumerlaeia bacterium]|nr:class I SAM-dependent methyltransferase [Candidatus Sumerlaeia bacterium]